MKIGCYIAYFHVAVRRFRTMLADYHGQAWNAAGPARALDVSVL
jgi:hypothetical protein